MQKNPIQKERENKTKDASQEMGRRLVEKELEEEIAHALV